MGRGGGYTHPLAFRTHPKRAESRLSPPPPPAIKKGGGGGGGARWKKARASTTRPARNLGREESSAAGNPCAPPPVSFISAFPPHSHAKQHVRILCPSPHPQERFQHVVESWIQPRWSTDPLLRPCVAGRRRGGHGAGRRLQEQEGRAHYEEADDPQHHTEY